MRVVAFLRFGSGLMQGGHCMPVQIPDPPEFGRQRCQILPTGEAVIQSTSETILAKDGEDREAFLCRLAEEHGVGPDDRVEITFRAGKPHYAVVERGAVSGKELSVCGEEDGERGDGRAYVG